MVSCEAATVLLAGSGGEIGGAIAARLAARGDCIALMGSEACALAASLALQGARVESVGADIADRVAIEAAIARVEDRLPPLAHVVFLLAAPSRQTPLGAITQSDWTAAVNGPLLSAFHLCQAAIPRLMARRQGSLLFIISDYAIIGCRDDAPFAALPTALYSFAKSIAREFAPAGIRVNCLGSARIAGNDNGSQPVPMGRPGRPREIAAVADFLLSNRASYITGQLLQPNGGRVMW
jgi:NAD(P)-dependent dehydrogenase (short-subunit alcohol dehydrogenase family)